MDHCIFMYPIKANSYTFDKLVIMGGRDLQQYFEDAYMLELAENLTECRWNDDVNVKAPNVDHLLCNNCCDAIESVPYHKVFSFGGKKGAMDYMNCIDVLDAGTQKWHNPHIVPHAKSELATDPPQAREASAWVYDNKRSALVMFGGWSSYWLADTWRLHAAPVIGPPYACTGIHPATGPVFGSTEMQISGLRFRDGSIQVKFTAGKNEAMAEGAFVDHTQINVLTPNFESFGPQQVKVLVQISGEGWTVQHQTFTYFANTAGRCCLAYGPGILADGVSGIQMPFTIQVRKTHPLLGFGCEEHTTGLNVVARDLAVASVASQGRDGQPCNLKP
jgi:dynein heavy chain, axonemal